MDRFDWKCSDVVREMHGHTIGEIGVLITNRPRGSPAYYVWHPEQIYNWKPVCPDCSGPAKNHGWSKHVVCMASENCALLQPRSSCPTCSTSASTKTFTVCSIRDQWPQEVVDEFPFILTPNSGVDVTLFSMVLEGLGKHGVPVTRSPWSAAERNLLESIREQVGRNKFVAIQKRWNEVVATGKYNGEDCVGIQPRGYSHLKSLASPTHGQAREGTACTKGEAQCSLSQESSHRSRPCINQGRLSFS